MRLQTLESRQASKKGASILILGQHGIGKTSLCRQLDPRETLFVDVENSLQSLEDWAGPALTGFVDWTEIRDLACLIGGPVPSALPDESFSAAHYKRAMEKWPDAAKKIDEVDTIFWDSFTRSARLAQAFAERSPKTNAPKGGKDKWAVFGMLADEMIAVIEHVQSRQDKNKVFVGIMDEAVDPMGRPVWEIQCPGSKTLKALPGILDNIASLVRVTVSEGCVSLANASTPQETPQFRALICQENPWKLFGKHRGSALQMIEQPDLAGILRRLNEHTPPKPMTMEPMSVPITQQQPGN